LVGFAMTGRTKPAQVKDQAEAGEKLIHLIRGALKTRLALESRGRGQVQESGQAAGRGKCTAKVQRTLTLSLRYDSRYSSVVVWLSVWSFRIRAWLQFGDIHIYIWLVGFPTPGDKRRL
jgi:hypothetical protein